MVRGFAGSIDSMIDRFKGGNMGLGMLLKRCHDGGGSGMPHEDHKKGGCPSRGAGRHVGQELLMDEAVLLAEAGGRIFEERRGGREKLWSGIRDDEECEEDEGKCEQENGAKIDG